MKKQKEEKTVKQVLRFWDILSTGICAVGGILILTGQLMNSGPKGLITTMGVFLFIAGVFILTSKMVCPYCKEAIETRWRIPDYCSRCGKDLNKPYDTRIRFD